MPKTVEFVQVSVYRDSTVLPAAVSHWNRIPSRIEFEY